MLTKKQAECMGNGDQEALREEILDELEQFIKEKWNVSGLKSTLFADTLASVICFEVYRDTLAGKNG